MTRNSPPDSPPTSSTRGHFDPIASTYARHRPGYPKTLIHWLVDRAPGRRLAWDCGTGNGQVARLLAPHVDQVVATDISPAQLAQAPALDGVAFRRAPAHSSGLATASVDLVVVAQALHWFDVQAFNREAQRVLRPDGLMAQWCYGGMETGVASIDAEISTFYRDVVGPYWPPERRHVETGYRDLHFPFERTPAPAFSMEAAWTLEDLLGYLRSWSATARYRQATGHDPVTDLAERIAPPWGPPSKPRPVQWPLTLRVGRLRPHPGR
ncbi:class I SAM-dependent methyltransferase [Guyparkeria hydrothermalis]|uniref:class I SAM-dependent methyltransferase n=1 Tax=Guyparkeria TaxID=2035712 RepID=UPI0010AC7C4D|nr:MULTISPECIES: class I SAM-dependent methyltransferase [Guyparkeria]MCL7750110.1 class I SAM-dependent methyltransferase [Guyparkeria hydrothermalis]TKA89216.1 class I SAM-dependent methyltransferase [Guyparkeria sp. SB14A]